MAKLRRQATASGQSGRRSAINAHGRTADIDRPLRLEFMGDDIATLIKQFGLQKS